MSLASDPIGMGQQPDIYRLRSREERHKARNTLAQVKLEGKMLDEMANDDWIAYVYQQSRTCPDERARVTWAKVAAEIARLGKREPVAASQQVNTGNVINVTVIQPLSAVDVFREIPEVK